MELRLKGIDTWDAANEFLKTTWVPFHNSTWSVSPQCPESAFVPYNGQDLERIFSIHHSRVVGNDNCVQFADLKLQIPQCHSRYGFAKCRVTVYQHLDGTISIARGPYTLGRYDSLWRPFVSIPKGSLRPTTGSRSPGSVRSSRPLPPQGGAHDKLNHRTYQLPQKPDILTY